MPFPRTEIYMDFTDLRTYYGSRAAFAKRRLWRDWQELQAAAPTTVSAGPSIDFLCWHCNIRPTEGPYTNIVFHIILDFPQDYPHQPPTCMLCHPFQHPNVFGEPEVDANGNGDYPYICLDLLKPSSTSEPYAGWSSAYSLYGILLQLQSFFFAEHIPQDYGNGGEMAITDPLAVSRTIKHARAFTITDKDVDGNDVLHTHDNPWAPLPRLMQEEISRPVKRPRIMNPTDTDGKTSDDTVALRDDRKLPAISTLLPSSLPNTVYTHIFGFLDPQGLFRARDVCRVWRTVIVTHNLFEISQTSCFHTKVRVDDSTCILGVGVKVSCVRRQPKKKPCSKPVRTFWPSIRGRDFINVVRYHFLHVRPCAIRCSKLCPTVSPRAIIKIVVVDKAAVAIAVDCTMHLPRFLFP